MRGRTSCPGPFHPGRSGPVPLGRHAIGVLAFVVAAGSLLGACTSPRNALGTPTSRCFKALPVARRAVEGEGRFSGVRYVTESALARALQGFHPLPVDIPRAVSSSTTGVCVVAYLGHFEAAAIAGGWPANASSGRLALVVVRAADERVLATVVLPRSPLHFNRTSPLDR